MKNRQIKLAYNVRYRVDAEYITWLIVDQKSTDTTILIPLKTWSKI